MNYEGFKSQVLSLTGIDLNCYKENQMKRRIDALIKKNGCDGYSSYIQLIKSDRKALEDFVAYLTINVTEFFRNPSQWEILEKHIIPFLMQEKGTLKIWSAACSTGDEPYSLAMTLAQLMPLSKFQIIATDIDKEVLEKAQAGVYTARTLANIPTKLRDKYMTKQDDNYVIRQEIKDRITFKKHNLLKDPYPSHMDLIVCRNVLIYFTEEAKRDIYINFNKALRNDGILFVGSTEQIIMCQEYGFEPNKIFFYQKVNTQKK